LRGKKSRAIPEPLLCFPSLDPFWRFRHSLCESDYVAVRILDRELASSGTAISLIDSDLAKGIPQFSMKHFEQVNKEQKRGEEQDAHHEARTYDKQPVLPRMLSLGLSVSDEQVVVAAIRLPSHVGKISNDWYRTEGGLQRQVEKHADYRDSRSPSYPSGPDDKKRGECSKGIAYSWNPTDQSIQSEAEPDSRHYKSIVQPVRD
jgi:hypothetical protein